jgi:predicted F0F1-ATPase subunit
MMAQPKMNKDEKKQKKKISLKGIGLTALGWEIALPIFGGVILGYNLDRWLETNYMFTLGLLGLGIFIGYYNIYKRIEVEMLRKKLSDKQNQKDDQPK